jgi:hypothetical protein
VPGNVPESYRMVMARIAIASGSSGPSNQSLMAPRQCFLRCDHGVVRQK